MSLLTHFCEANKMTETVNKRQKATKSYGLMFKSVFVHNPSTLLIEENSLHESSFGALHFFTNLTVT